MQSKVAIINIASLAAIVSLIVGMASALMAFTGRLDMDAYKLVFDVSSLVWFLSSPFWFVPHLFGEGFKEAGKRAWLRPSHEE